MLNAIIEPHQLSVCNLSKQHHHRVIVNNLSLSIKAGEIVGLLGPNGAGKTSCFYMILGLMQADAGAVLLNNIDLSHLPIHQRSRLGLSYLPQEASIFRKLSVADNIKAILETRSDLNSTAQQTILETLLHEFRITAIRNLLGFKLSGGERRRVEIARALARNPKFMLLDEPFAGVDPLSILDIKQNARHLANRGIGVLITDHNVRETLDICDRAYVLYEGNLIAEGNSEYILKHPQVLKVYLGHNFKI